jgi:hypothetical protein
MGSSSNDGSDLRSLLKLKRYEQPPPRFFDGLSEDVLHRLRGPEGLREQSLITSLGLRFGLKPALFYGLGFACCALAFYGVVSLLVKSPPPVPADQLMANSPGGQPQEVQHAGGGSLFAAEPSHGSGAISTNPVLSPGGVAYPIDISRVKPTPAAFHSK